MKRISFNPRFVNETGDDLIPGKIHTIRQNYEYWKQFEGREVALFTWDGKPYQKGSKQKVFCVKRIVSIQKILYRRPEKRMNGFYFVFENKEDADIYNTIHNNHKIISKNDGFENIDDYFSWFNGDYTSGEMAILHFTDFRYGEDE